GARPSSAAAISKQTFSFEARSWAERSPYQNQDAKYPAHPSASKPMIHALIANRRSGDHIKNGLMIRRTNDAAAKENSIGRRNDSPNPRMRTEMCPLPQ